MGTMKSQLPWGLEEADLAFCHSAAWTGTPPKARAHGRARGGVRLHRELVEQVGKRRARATILCMSNGGLAASTLLSGRVGGHRTLRLSCRRATSHRGRFDVL